MQFQRRCFLALKQFVTRLFLPGRNCTYCQLINLYISLSGLLCMEKICWQPLCQTQPSHSISTKSLVWQKKWWVVPHNQHVMHMFALFYCPVMKEHSSVSICVLPQALRVSDHYPVEVELHNAPPFWVAKSCQRCDNVDTQQASVNRAVTGKQQKCNLVSGVTDRQGVKYLGQELTYLMFSSFDMYSAELPLGTAGV